MATTTIYPLGDVSQDYLRLQSPIDGLNSGETLEVMGATNPGGVPTAWKQAKLGQTKYTNAIPGGIPSIVGVQATGSVVCPAGAAAINQTVTITDAFMHVRFYPGSFLTKTFQFATVASAGSVPSNFVAVIITAGDTAAQVAEALKLAIVASGLKVAVTRNTATLSLTQDSPSAYGNSPIDCSSEDFTVSDFSGGESGFVEYYFNAFGKMVPKEWVTAPIYFGTLYRPEDLPAPYYPVVEGSMSFRVGGTGAFTEQGYFSGNNQLTNNGSIVKYCDIGYGAAGVVYKTEDISFKGLTPLSTALEVGFITYSTGDFLFADVAGEFAVAGLGISYGVGNYALRTDKTDITITGAPLVNSAPVTVIESAVGNYARSIYSHGNRVQNCGFIYDGKGNGVTTIKNIKFQRGCCGISFGEAHTPSFGEAGACSPVRLEDCVFEKFGIAATVFVSCDFTYPNLGTAAFDYTTTEKSFSWIKRCTVKDGIYVFATNACELTIENCAIGPMNVFDNCFTYPASWQIYAGHLVSDGVDRGQRLVRNVLIQNNTFNNINPDNSYSSLRHIYAYVYGSPLYDGFNTGNAIAIEAEGPGLTELIDVVGNTFIGLKSIETALMTVIPGFHAVARKITFDGNICQKTAGPIFYAMPTCFHFTDPYFTGIIADVTVTGTVLQECLNQDLWIGAGPLGSPPLIRKPSMLAYGNANILTPDEFQPAGTCGGVKFIKNNWRSSGLLPFSSFDDVGTSLVYLEGTTHDCVVQENGGLPTGGGGSKNYVTDAARASGQTTNRVIGLPANTVIKPAGYAQALQRASATGLFAESRQAGTKKVTLKAFTVPAHP